MPVHKHASAPAACEPADWGASKNRWSSWHRDLGISQIQRKIPNTVRPEERLARLVTDVSGEAATKRLDSSFLPNLEARLQTTNDAEVRKLLAIYLSEP